MKIIRLLFSATFVSKGGSVAFGVTLALNIGGGRVDVDVDVDVDVEQIFGS